MRKIFSILITLGLVLGLVVIAAPTSASSGLSFVEVELQTKGAATAEWSTVQKYSGSYSVHLETTGTPGSGDEARVVMPVPAGTTLGDIDSIAWREYLVKGYPPHVDIILDTSGITGTPGTTDALVIEYAYNTVTHAGEGQITGTTCYGALNGSWYQTFSDDGNGPAVIDGTANAWLTSGAPGPLGAEVTGIAYAAVGSQFVYDTLSDWQAGLAVNEIGASTPVLRLEIEIDNWIAQAEAYLDYVSINPIYDLEPTVGPNCACATAEYTILFITTASLTEGFNSVFVEFPEGTTVPGTFEDGDITINGMDVFGLEVTVDGTTVSFLVPEDVDPGVITQVTFTADAGIKNPCTPGDYTLFVWTDRAPDATPVESAKYTIAPAYSSYDFEVDFGTTYPGIAKGFIPPFKACGQNDSLETADDQAFNTTYNASVGWLDYFTLTFGTDVIGCDTPCDTVSVWFEVTACPEDEVITLLLDGTWYTLDDEDVTTVVGTYDSAADFVVDSSLSLTTNMTVPYDGQLHFSSVASYQICFYAECPAVTGCDPEASAIIAEKCLDFEVHQWKDAFKLELDEKWNLISLPLVPFDTDINAILAAMPAAELANLVSIWNYDACTGEWFIYGNGHDSLMTLEDGKGYWFRMKYPMAGLATLWLWGTEKPMPPLMPAEYPVCEGWNQIGFTSLTAYDAQDYLWNWDGLVGDPVVYEWLAGDWTAQGWNMLNFDGGDDMVPGQGYWVAFGSDGMIYVP